MTTVLLRADATEEGGAGHVVRALAVAEAVRDSGGDVVLCGRVDTPLARRLVGAAGIEVVAPVPAARVAALAAAVGADVVHVDHYGADVVPLGRGWAGEGVLVSSIEDGVFGRRPADLVVDPTPGSAPRPDDGSGTVLRGVRFAPMRGLVRAARALRAPDRADPRVLVVLGGSDAFGETRRVVAAVRAAGARDVVAVAPEHSLDGLAGVTALGPQDDLPGLAATCDLVVSAAGTTTWELACVGVPAALVTVTENQVLGARRAAEAGIARLLGPVEDLRPGTAGSPAVASLAELVARGDLRREMRRRGRALVDGRGAARLVAAWHRAVGPGGTLLARPADAEDADTLHVWRDDPATRASSRSTAPVPRERHVQWLASVLDDPDRLLLVVEDPQQDARPVGTVRFDRKADGGPWEVSITVAPEARGRGLGRQVLEAGWAAWRGRTGGGTVQAVVRPDNLASVRLFEASGWRPGPPTAEGLATFER